MRNRILLISEDTIRSYSNINDNLFSKWLLPAIRESQEMGLMPIIGECLYNRICDLVGNDLIGDDMYVQYKDLLDDYIEPYLIYQTLTNVTPLINGKMGNIGTVSTNDEHIINLSQGELDLVQNYYRERADFYQIRLQNWVKANASAFPELECSCENMQPNLDRANNSVGLWLGGVRGKRMAQKCSCGGEQKSQGGDYAQGYADGYASGRTAQRALIQELEITENGTYESADGFSPIVVDIESGSCNMQDKSVVFPSGVTEFSVVPDSGYDGMSSVEVDGSAEISRVYNVGYSSGVNDTKAAMVIEATFNENGTSLFPNGVKKVIVAVPQTGGSCNLQEKVEEIPLGYSNITVYPDYGYDGMSAVTVGARDVITEGYTSGYTNGYSTGYEDGYAAAISGSTGSTATTEARVENFIFERDWGGLNDGDYLWNPEADSSNLTVIIGDSVWTGGPVYYGRSISVIKILYIFSDGVVPLNFFNGNTTLDFVTVEDARVEQYAFYNTSAHYIHTNNSYLEDSSISTNSRMTRMNIGNRTDGGMFCIENNQSLAHIEANSTLPSALYAFNQSAPNGLLEYRDPDVLATNWWNSLERDGWTAISM